MVHFDHISEIGRIDKAIKHAPGNQEWNIGHKKAYDGFPTPFLKLFWRPVRYGHRFHPFYTLLGLNSP